MCCVGVDAWSVSDHYQKYPWNTCWLNTFHDLYHHMADITMKLPFGESRCDLYILQQSLVVCLCVWLVILFFLNCGLSSRLSPLNVLLVLLANFKFMGLRFFWSMKDMWVRWYLCIKICVPKHCLAHLVIKL